MANTINYKPKNPHLTQDLKEDSYLWKKKRQKQQFHYARYYSEIKEETYV